MKLIGVPKTALVVWSILMILTLGGCESTPTAEQMRSARVLMDASEVCVRQVRDGGMKYRESPACNSLGQLSLAYIAAGGGKESSPRETELMFFIAQKQAWMALALSASGGLETRIW